MKRADSIWKKRDEEIWRSLVSSILDFRFWILDREEPRDFSNMTKRSQIQNPKSKIQNGYTRRTLEHGHYHPPGLQHQFEDMKQQEESVSIGMWMFLVQEIMFFGGLFTVYLVFRSKFPMAFAAGSNHLDAFWGGLNTLVLIVSSLTMALTVYYAQKGNRNMQVILILLTMFFGAVFLGVKRSSTRTNTITGLSPLRDGTRRSRMARAHSCEPPASMSTSRCWEMGHGT